MKVDVYHYGPEKMTYACCASMNSALDALGARHHWGYGVEAERPLPQTGGGVVVFHGGNEEAIGRGDAIAAILSAETARWDWVIFVNIGDEAGVFPCHLLVHRNYRVYSQTVKPGTKNAFVADRFMIEGTPADCRPTLDKIGVIPRDLDWFFAGQVTHPRRHDCVNALEAYRKPRRFKEGYGRGLAAPDGSHDWYSCSSILIKTQSFGAGLSHDTYYEFMRRAKVIPCPAGPVTPDSFRAAEALECGCVPLLDAWSPDRVPGYWDLVFGDHPFYVIEDWEKEFEFVMASVLANWDVEAARCQEFWSRYKKDFSQWWVRDMIAMGVI